MKNLIPSKGDKKVGPKIFELLEVVIRDKQDIGIHAKIKRNHELRMGEHWKNLNQQVPLVAANLIFNHMQKNCNLLTDNNPIFNVAKSGNLSVDKEDALDLIQRTAEHWWNEQEQQAIYEDTVLFGEEYGVTIEYTKFNRHLEWGIGEVETLNVDPLYFGFYPTKLKNPRDIQKADAVFYFYPMSVREIKRLWPDTSQKIKPDEELQAELQDDRREINQKKSSESEFYGKLITIASNIKEMLSFMFGDDTDEAETLVVECWCKDYSYEKVEGEDKERPVYPGFIRRVIACNGGDVVLADDPNPSINPMLDFEQARKCYLFDKYPMYARNSVRDTSSFWGFTDIEQLDKLNMEFNKSLSQLVLIKDRKARSKIVNPLTSGVEDEEFTNIAGTIRPANSIEAQAIRYLTFDGDTKDFEECLNIFKEIFYTIAGTFELDQTQTPGKNIIAYKAIAALIEQASTMRKGKVRAYSSMALLRGRCYISLAQNWYTDERWITYEKDGATEAQAITNQDLLIPAKLTVVIGSTLPVSKVQKREEAIALYQQGAIDLEQLHTDLETTNRRALLQRMKQGPFGIQAQRMQGLGMPPDLTGYISELGTMDDKDFERAFEKGELPTFEVIFQQLMQQGQEQEAPPDPMQELEIQEKGAKISESEAKTSESRAKIDEADAKIRKIDAEIALIAEKVKSERIEQLVKIEGVNFDSEKLKIERQRVVNELAKILEPDKGKQSEAKPGFTERGIRSNNE